MTDDQSERIKKGLNFHSEGGIYNLCTLTETALREIIEDAVKFYEKQQKIDALHIMELQKQNGELTDKVKKLKEELEQAKKVKVVEHFEAYGQCRDSRRIAELEAQIEGKENEFQYFSNSFKIKITKLEKENAELKDVIEGYKKIAKWCDNCDEIAELKSENQKWKDEWQEQVQKATDEGYARTLQTIQLTKAKDHIKKLLDCLKQDTNDPQTNYYVCQYMDKAEQFISEVENDRKTNGLG